MITVAIRLATTASRDMIWSTSINLYTQGDQTLLYHFPKTGRASTVDGNKHFLNVSLESTCPKYVFNESGGELAWCTS